MSLDITGSVPKAEETSGRVSAVAGVQIKAELAASLHDAQLH